MNAANHLTYVDIDFSKGRVRHAEDFSAVLGFALPSEPAANLAGAAAAVLQRVVAEDRPLLAQAWRRLLAGESVGRVRFAVTDDSARERTIECVWHVAEGDGPEPRAAFVTCCDTSARQRTEDTLGESEARYRSALIAGRMGSWETDLVAGTRTWSQEGLELFGLELPDGRGQVGGEHDEYLRALHPQDRHLMREFHVIADRLDSFPAEYRIVRKDGRQLWLSGRGLVVSRTPEGKAQRLVSIMADATERRRAEETLRIERERLELALSAGLMGAYDMNLLDGTLWWSPQTYVVFGVSPEHFTPSPVSVAALVHEDDRATFLSRREEAIALRQPLLQEFRSVRPDGSLAWIAHRGRFEYDAEGRPVRSFGVATDISERKRAEEIERRAVAEARQASAVNAKFRFFFEQGSYFAAVMTLDGVLIDVNELALTLGGLHRSQVVGRQFWDCGWWSASADLVEMVRAGTALAAAGQTFRRETPYRRADGSLRVIDLIIAPVSNDAGEVIFLAPTGVDITDRKRAEDDLRRLASELAAADRRKTEFLATLAHELRNPLAPLRNALFILRRGASDAGAVERAVAMMERQLGHLVRLVDDLLDIARINGGKVDLHRQRVALQEVLSSAVETCLPLIHAAGHELLVDVPHEPLFLHADATRLSQVVSNLLNNAAKYTDPGGRIELRAWREGAEVLICVIDNGVGIPQDALESVFEMFAQIESRKGQAAGGLGIGLSLVRQLVELHGGSVVASRREAGGSALTVRLPLAESMPETVAGPLPVPAAPGEAPACLRILVADDNTDGAETLASLLRLHRHEVWVAHDGEHALRAALQLRPDIAFLDIGMPGKSGHEVAAGIRAAPGMAGAVLVALTGFGAEHDRAATRAAGFDQHMTKPAAPEAVLAFVSRIGIGRLR